MKCELNYKVDEHTVNGHIYPKEVLIKAFDSRLKNGPFPVIPSSKDINNGFVPVSKYIGLVQSYEIEDDGTVYFEVKPIETPFGKMMEDMLKVFKLTTVGVGMLKRDKKTISNDYILSALFLSKNDEYE